MGADQNQQKEQNAEALDHFDPHQPQSIRDSSRMKFMGGTGHLLWRKANLNCRYNGELMCVRLSERGTTLTIMPHNLPSGVCMIVRSSAVLSKMHLNIDEIAIIGKRWHVCLADRRT